MRRRTRATDDLETLPGVGPSIAVDLRELGVRSARALGRRDPERLYARLNARRRTRQDPCLLYTFRCAVYAARSPRPRPSLLKWWNWKNRALDDLRSRRPERPAQTRSAAANSAGRR